MKKYSSFCAITLFLISFLLPNYIIAQNSASATPSKVGSSKKQTINEEYDFFSNEPYDYGVTINPPTTVVGRSIWSFTLPTAITAGSQITRISFSYRTNTGSGFDAYHTTGVPASPSLQQKWEYAGSGSHINYYPGSSGSTYTYDLPSSICSEVESAIASSATKIYIGFISNYEDTYTPATTISNLSMTIYYNKPVVFTIINNVNACSLKVNSTNRASGYVLNTYENTSVALEAIEPQTLSGNTLVWNDTEGTEYKSEWERIAGSVTTNKGQSQAINFAATLDDNNSTYQANLKYKYDVTLSSYGGIILNGTTCSSPQTRQIVEGNTVTAEITVEMYTSNDINYYFSQWSNGSTSQSTTFTINSTQTITANYLGYAYTPNVHFDGSAGEPIIVDWDDHPNTAVTQYQVWRIDPDHPNGVLLATRNRGTTSYTDYNYFHYESGDYYKLYYAVTAKYETSTYYTWSTQNWRSILGEEGLNIKSTDEPVAEAAVVAEIEETELSYSIGNSPNPFNPTTQISYTLPDAEQVTIKVYNTLGKEVATLVNSVQTKGKHVVNFNAGNLASGIYIYTIQTPNYAASKKMILLK